MYEADYFEKQKYTEKETAIKDLYRRFLTWANLLEGNGKLALDAGAGFGYVVELLQELGYNALGLELSPFACEQSRLHDRIVNADITNMPFTKNSFVLITCFETIEHIGEAETALKEFARILKPNGTLLISTPTRFGSWISGQDEYHPSLKERHGWATMLSRTGFGHTLARPYTLTPRLRGRYRVLFGGKPATHNLIMTRKRL